MSDNTSYLTFPQTEAPLSFSFNPTVSSEYVFKTEILVSPSRGSGREADFAPHRVLADRPLVTYRRACLNVGLPNVPKGSFRQRLHRAQKKPEGVSQRAGYELIVVSVRLYRVELRAVPVFRDVNFESRLAQGLQVVCESLGELPG